MSDAKQMDQGIFITFEGIDGSGKSTHLRLLASELRLRGYNLVTTREPGGTPLGAKLRELLLEAEELVDPLAELLLYAADRAQHVRTLVRPALATGHIVLSDRYTDATVAYQGAGRGFSPQLIADVVRIGSDGLRPHLTLILDVPVATARARLRQRRNDQQDEDRMEREEMGFHERVRNTYLRIATDEPERVRLIDASGSVEETHARVMETVLPFVEARGWTAMS